MRVSVHHNIHTNHAKASVSCCTDVFEASTQTDITPALSVCQQTLAPTLKAESIQTDPLIHKKSQMVKFSDSYWRIQTLPIPPTSNAATQMDHVGIPCKTTMTPITECNDDAIITDLPVAKHSHTLRVETVNTKSDPYSSSGASPPDHLDNSPNCASAKTQTDSPLPYAKKKTKIQWSPLSDIWVETVADHLTDNEFVLKSMKESLDSRGEICDDSSVTWAINSSQRDLVYSD